MELVTTEADTAKSPLINAQHRIRSWFTADNARAMADIGRQRRQERKAQNAITASLPIEDRQKPVEDTFPAKILSRVRKQIASVMDSLEQALTDPEPDSKRCKDMSDCLSRLAELERQLAGRPLPGSMRPSAAKVRRPASTISAPTLADPE